MFQVLKIIDVRYTKSDKREFLIRWKNYSPKQDSWEPEENLSCDELISKFLEDQDKVNIYMAQNRFSGENIFNIFILPPQFHMKMTNSLFLLIHSQRSKEPAKQLRKKPTAVKRFTSPGNRRSKRTGGNPK